MPPLLTVKIVRPSVSLHESFREALTEYEADGAGSSLTAASAASADNFARYVDFLNACEYGTPPYAGVVRWASIDGVFVGRLVLRHHADDLSVSTDGNVGYSVRPSFRGRGVATALLAEAVRLSAVYAITPVLSIEEANLGSRRVAQKNGFVYRSASGSVLSYTL